jgi:hypothetical protein
MRIACYGNSTARRDAGHKSQAKDRMLATLAIADTARDAKKASVTAVKKTVIIFGAPGVASL